ncbi:mitochondrial carrier [Auriscalpium vulgare]|uniref:Mitochondrial carrier n=1 Tax=Auriscalpium vulgare TaxID=40419 RepID=A0ACB8RN15_9AGAM|nr:mitochondrial carrier [Auriscalpium vulgare]
MADEHGPRKRDIFDGSVSGAQERPFIPRLRSDARASFHPLPRNLVQFREAEGRENRKQRLRTLWRRLPPVDQTPADADDVVTAIASGHNTSLSLTPERARKIRREYERELAGSCPSKEPSGRISWKDFVKYAESKEVELWHTFHDELDLDNNGHLDAEELAVALQKAGITLSPSTLSDFMTYLTASPHSHSISFAEFRDFLLLLPRKVSTVEIYQFYEVRKFLGDDGRGAARVTMEGDVSLSAEDKPPNNIMYRPLSAPSGEHALNVLEVDDEDGFDDDFETPEEHHWLDGHMAIKFLAAGGVAGAGESLLSRTCTAPFDRLKIFLITRPPDLGGNALQPQVYTQGLKAIGSAIAKIYAEGGVAAFWVGNGLSVAKILPESAIKFMTYESSKRMFAQYVDHVEDPREISGTSRFMSGGLGGITAQLSIYPIETLKTQMMSSAGEPRRSLVNAAQRLWALGGLRAYYRGLGAGLLGVFPYSAIDMSTFEALKLAYLRSTGKDEPGVLALLAFGSVSGSVGATSVYPLNLVRTRLQASGSSGHPQRYHGIRDVAIKTYEREGWRGFYRGLIPTLAKVIPAVSISYVVYEQSKRKYVGSGCIPRVRN